MTPHETDMSEWEKVAGRWQTRAKAGLVAALCIGLPLLASFDRTASHGTKLGLWALFGGFGLLFAWVALRPVKLHPFIKMMTTRAAEVKTIYLHELFVNGRYSATFLTMITGDNKQQRLDVPRGEGEQWKARLQALIPHAEFKNEVPPAKWF